jgi:hypothetical protein
MVSVGSLKRNEKRAQPGELKEYKGVRRDTKEYKEYGWKSE